MRAAQRLAKTNPHFRSALRMEILGMNNNSKIIQDLKSARAALAREYQKMLKISATPETKALGIGALEIDNLHHQMEEVVATIDRWIRLLQP